MIDLRYVNQHLVMHKFKFEGLDLIPSMFKQGDWAFSFDLKSGYHHVDIHESSRAYLGFSWDHGNERRYYYFPSVSLLHVVFTKLLRPLVKRWRSMGLNMMVYIDDGIGVSFPELFVMLNCVVLGVLL